jgi:hypothetical protein
MITIVHPLRDAVQTGAPLHSFAPGFAHGTAATPVLIFKQKEALVL